MPLLLPSDRYTVAGAFVGFHGSKRQTDKYFNKQAIRLHSLQLTILPTSYDATSDTTHPTQGAVVHLTVYACRCQDAGKVWW
jgi:hypothetical protein